VVEVHSNPYDFTRPISEPALLAGRSKELDKMKYYLDQALGEKPRFYNLALVGKRASGKTSFLNVVKQLAKEREILAVKVTLNSEMVHNHMLLYREIIDGILTEGHSHGMYRGLRGWISRRVKRISGSADVEMSLPGVKIRFSSSEDVKEADISQQVLVKALEELLSEARKRGIRGVAVLLDECDILALDVILLQKLRNVMQNLNGYIFVFTGTDQMFSAFSESFSPFPRSFITIKVEDFQDAEQTADCILRPLTEEERKLVDRSSVAEIHGFTGGSPYEITLVAHYMYKIHKDTGSQAIKLTVDVLDAVMEEIERLRQEGHHDVAFRIKRCFPPALRVLLSLLSFDKCTADELAWYMLLDKIDTLTDRGVRDDVSHSKVLIGNLVSQEILDENDEHQLSFRGDSFDRLYLRYFALSKGLTGIIRPAMEPIETLANAVDGHLTEGAKNFETIIMFDRVRDIDGQVFMMGAHKTAEQAGPLSITISPHEMHTQFYHDLENAIRFRINVKYLDNGFVVQHKFDNPSDKEIVLSRVDQMLERFKIAGIELVRDDEITLVNKGQKLSLEGNRIQALDCFDRAIALNPRLGLPYLGKSQALFNSQEYVDALELCEKALDIEPKWSQAWELKGRCLFHLGDYWKSIKYFDKAIEHDPENFQAWNNKGRALHILRQHEDAVLCFEKILGEKDILTMNWYARSLWMIQQKERAMQTLDDALEKDPDDLEALIAKGQFLGESRQYDTAKRVLLRVIQKHPDVSDGYGNLGLVCLEMNLLDEALEYLNTALSLDPSNASAWYNKACALSRKDESSEAIDALERAVELNANYQIRAADDKDFDSIRESAEFQNLIELKT
jgi:tetratricopeptide (TPR) repeat protein